MSAASATPRHENDQVHPIERDAWIADLIRENEELKKELARVDTRTDAGLPVTTAADGAPDSDADAGDVMCDGNGECFSLHDALQDLQATNNALLAALVAMLDRYTSLVKCGDCGNWDPEQETEVIAARAAIAKAVN